MLDPNQLAGAYRQTQPLDLMGSAERGMQFAQNVQGIQTAKRLREIAGSTDLSTPEGQAKYAAEVSRVNPEAGMKLQEELLARKQKRLTDAYALETSIGAFEESTQKHMSAAAQEAAAKAEAAKLATDPKEKAAALVDILTLNMSKMRPRALDDEPTKAVKAHGIQKSAELLRNLGSMSPSQIDQTLDSMILSGNTFKDWQTLRKEKLDREAKAGDAASPLGKIQADLKAGRITQTQADAAIRKETRIPADLSEVQRETNRTNRDIASQKRTVDVEMKLADDYRAESKGFAEVATSIKKVFAALTTADKNPGSALAAGTAFMKILDPNSVVRESELGMALNASGWFDRASNVVQSLKSGKIMTPEQIKNLKIASEALFEEAKAAQREIDSSFEIRAKNYGANPANIITDRGQRNQTNNGPSKPSNLPTATGPNGEKIVLKNGAWVPVK